MGNGSLREVMPDAAAIVDQLRGLLGSEVVDRALSAGIKLQREYQRLEAEQGTGHAKAWLALQRPSGAFFQVTEGGRQVGMLPGCPAVGVAKRGRR